MTDPDTRHDTERPSDSARRARRARAHATLEGHLGRKRASALALLTAFEEVEAAAERLADPPAGDTIEARRCAVTHATTVDRHVRSTYRTAWSAALRDGWTPRELATIDLLPPPPSRHRG
jgi:hypothetical protein